MKRGQAAMEFLTTYGWALIFILAVLGGIFYFGVLDTKPYSNLVATKEYRSFYLCGFNKDNVVAGDHYQDSTTTLGYDGNLSAVSQIAFYNPDSMAWSKYNGAALNISSNRCQEFLRYDGWNLYLVNTNVLKEATVYE